MKKIPNWLILLIVFAILIGSKFLFFKPKEEQAQSAAGKKNAPVAVNYIVLKPDTFSDRIFTTGKTGAFNQLEIVPETSGKVVAILFKEGETVQKGQLLLKLNDADLQAQLQKITNQLELSELKLSRLKKLITINGVSQEDMDIQENEMKALTADKALLHAQIAKTAITAPFSGVVGLKNISEGSFVTPQTPVVRLVQLDPLFIEFSIPEKYNALIRKGSRISFLAEESEVMETAEVYAIEPMVDELTRSIRVRASYRSNKAIYPGSFVKVYPESEKKANALLVPTQCVIPTLKGQKVWVVKNGLATEAMVKTGVRTDTHIQITDGLVAGDTVVSSGLLAVKKDSPLKLLKPNK
ncbi:MAG: efflux RND transporter periplasmic adaptor subunit [Sediminibacterium sp.]|nr:efflux RND transporter periplasmic adaptor subunit [Sediminibacterium sp.]